MLMSIAKQETSASVNNSPIIHWPSMPFSIRWMETLTLRRQSSSWLGQELIVLRYRDIEPDVHIQTDLDDRPGKFYLVDGDLE